MIAVLALLSLAVATQPWIVRSQTNLLGQPETVAEMAETPGMPGRFLKFSCSVMSGPVLEAGLGARTFEDFARFSADDATKNATLSLTLQYGGAILSVSAAPVAENVTAYAYTVAGSDAIAAAKAIQSASAIGIATAGIRIDFDVSGAAPAIGQVLDACPFKG